MEKANKLDIEGSTSLSFIFFSSLSLFAPDLEEAHSLAAAVGAEDAAAAGGVVAAAVGPVVAALVNGDAAPSVERKRSGPSAETNGRRRKKEEEGRRRVINKRMKAGE